MGTKSGDPGLITVAGLEAQKSGDVVVYDSLAGEELLNEEGKDIELIDVGKRAGFHKVSQQGINEMIVAKAREGKKVVRLKGGDPFMFGRGGEEAEELRRAGAKVHVIPSCPPASSPRRWPGSRSRTATTHPSSLATRGPERRRRSTGAGWPGSAAQS